MKGIELLSLTSDQKKLLETSYINYKRFAHVVFTIISASDSEIVVKSVQTENAAGKYLTAKELIERTKEVFNVLPEMKIHVRPIPFQNNGFENFDIDALESNMKELGLKPKDLVELTGIDKTSISRLMNSGRELTKIHKAMFYYLFKYLRK